MNLSFDLILECLSRFEAKALPTAEHRLSFSGIRLLCRNSETELRHDILYVTDLKMIRHMSKSELSSHCFIFSATEEELSRVPNCTDAIIYPSGYVLGDIANYLFALFEKVSAAEYRLRLAVRAKAGYEPLMDVMRELLPDATIVVADSAYNIITASRDGGSGNGYIDRLLRQGYYDKDSLQRMAGHGYFTANDRYLRPILSMPPNVCGDPVILRSYHWRKSFFAFAGCYLHGRVPTLLEQEYFRCFTLNLEDFFRKTNFFAESIPKHQQMVADLLSENASPDLIRDRAAGLHLPEKAEYRIGCAEFDEDCHISAAHLTLQLRTWSNVPNFGIFQYKQSTVIVFHDWHDGNTAKQLAYQERWNEMLDIVEKNGARLGVSLMFTEISKFRVGYEQARSALEAGRRLHPERREYHYSKYAVEDILQNYAGKFDLDDVRVKSVDRLMDDSGSWNSNLKILYHYLSTERNISITAKRLHMHRNSVIYRLQKIQDLLGLNLNDPDVRLRLMLNFKLLELVHGESVDGEEPEPDSADDSLYILPE